MYNFIFSILFFCLGWLYAIESSTTTKPNILIIVADDWGFNDIGWHENTNILTPYLDSLVKEEGLRFSSHYAYFMCSPSRASFLTGRYPIRYGLTNSNVDTLGVTAISKYETFMPEVFQDNGYKTHAIGKWHLGHIAEAYTPWKRGFDTFEGYLLGKIDYYTHRAHLGGLSGIDLRNKNQGLNLSGVYNPYIERDGVLNILEQYAEESNPDPFFLYAAFQLGHLPDNETPECEKNYFLLYKNSSFSDVRKCYQAQITTMDDIVKQIATQLKTTGLWNNTLVLFFSDNGPQAATGDASPLRGYKETFWEGGVRTVAFLTGGFLPSYQQGEIWPYPIHITDWLPTLLSASNIYNKLDSKYIATLDGNNIWENIKNNYDENNGGNENNNNNDLYNKIMLYGIENFECGLDVCGAIYYNGYKLLISDYYLITNTETCDWNRNYQLTDHDVLNCGDIPNDINTQDCNTCTNSLCLFNLTNDPCEYYNNCRR